MSSLNKVLLIGRLGNDPEIRSFSSGGRVCNLSLATSEHWTEKSTGERKSKTQWHRVVIFNDNLVTVAEKYLRKGAKVYIEGRLETRKWTDKDGKDQFSTEVVIKQFGGELQMLDGKKDGGHGDAGDYAPPAATARPSYYGSAASRSAPASSEPPLNDEIPF